MVETKSITRKKARIFYGYWIVAVAFLCLFITAGCGFYGFNLFVIPLQKAFGWSRAEIMMATTIWTLTQGVFAPWVGRMIDRHDPRRIIIIGALLSSLALTLLTMTNELWQFYLFYGLYGCGFAATNVLPVSAIIFNWFKRKRGLAIGIAGTGVGAGGFVFSLLIGGYLIPALGWRKTFPILGLIMTAVIPLMLLVVKTRPEDIGLQPDGDEAPLEDVAHRSSRKTPEDSLSMGQTFKTWNFWLISFAATTFGFSTMAIIRNQVAHLEDIGFSAAAAAGALGMVGIGNGIGKFAFGFIGDWVKPKLSMAIGLGLQLIAVTILMMVSPTSPAVAIWLYAAFMGLGQGSWMPTMSMLISTNFGMAAYGTIFGMINLINVIGASSGPLLAGYIYDTRNSYDLAFIICIATYIIGIVLALSIRPPGLPE